jgi:hypothetical protein
MAQHISNRERSVKAFLFVLINRELARGDHKPLHGKSSTKIREKLNFCMRIKALRKFYLRAAVLPAFKSSEPGIHVF